MGPLWGRAVQRSIVRRAARGAQPVRLGRGAKGVSLRTQPFPTFLPMKNHRGLSLIQFLLILLVGGIVALWLVDYLRARLA